MNEAPLPSPKPPPLPMQGTPRPMPRPSPTRDATTVAVGRGYPLWMYVVAGGLGAFIMLPVALLILALMFWPRASTATDAAADPSPVADPSHAQVYRETCALVREHLLSPKSAEFGDATVERLNGAKPNWKVAGTLDAQNQFGVFIRAKFEAESSFEPTTRRWELAYATLNDDVLYASDDLKKALAAFDAAKLRAEESRPWRLIKKEFDSATSKTATFVVSQPPLRLSWQTFGDHFFAVWLVDEATDERELVVNVTAEGSSQTTLRVPSGRYYLDVKASGPWKVTLEEK